MSENTKKNPLQSLYLAYKNRRLNKKARLESIKQSSDPGLAEYLLYLSSPFRVFFINFLAGIGRGLGFILGATVVVAILLYIIGTVLAGVPIVGDFFQWLNKFLEENLRNSQLPRGGV